MCGIVGVLASKPVADYLMAGLSRLEYRGYDSSGIATLTDDAIECVRAEGKLENLAQKLKQKPILGNVGIGHTRWATHGRPSEANAHPHISDRVAVVHNGIIENYQKLREGLIHKGCVFKSETDSEVITHLLTDYLNQGMTPAQAMAKTLGQLRGAFALAILFKWHNNLMMGARRGSPLAVGYGDNDEMYLGSDAIALAPMTSRISYLEDGDWVQLTPGTASFYDAEDRAVERAIKQSSVSKSMSEKGQYDHFMVKEIFEQPAVIEKTLQSLVGQYGAKVDIDWATVSRLTITACGTAFYAGLVAKYWFEQIARLPVEVDVASEYRYRQAPLPENGVFMAISQSGETADTLAATSYAQSLGQKIIAVVNGAESTLARQADVVIQTLAGAEIGVASTKAYTTQLVAILSLAVMAGQARGVLTAQRQSEIVGAMLDLPNKIQDILRDCHKVQALAQKLRGADNALYLGRGLLYPIALEGALKLKEITYIHAEGYAAGEMKHGPIALIDDKMPVIVLVCADEVFEKTLSNLAEVSARGGRVILFAPQNILGAVTTELSGHLTMPECASVVAPILYAIPMQLLAYYTALAIGTNVDKPRNLAKSVTVE